jgi:hypothetical protein
VNGLRAMLDASLEIVIGFARFVTVAAVLTCVGYAGAWIWFGDARFGGLSALALVVGAAAGWFGFWLFGNEEWRRGKTDNRAA